MKFAVVPRILSLTLAATLALVLTGCGFGSSNHNLALTQGNWSVSATSTNSLNAFLIGGNLTQNGTSISGKAHITGADPGCNIDSAQAVNMTGTTNGTNIALTSGSIGGQVITIAATGSGSAFSGTYVIAGGNCDGDQGTIAANAVASVSGTWNGTLTVNTDPTVRISVLLMQASTPSADGTFALTGTVAYTGSSCPATATLLPSWVSGVNLTINTDSGVVYLPTADSASAPNNMTGDYDSTGDDCASSDGIQSVTLTKQ